MSEFLSVYRETAEDLLEEALPALLAGALDYPALLDFCGYFRTKGIASLLLECDAEALHRNLYNSARAFETGLRYIGADGAAASVAAPLFDAIACNDAAAAARIAGGLRPTFDKESEYEDDFLYVQYLSRRFLLRAPDAEVARILERLEQSGPPDAPRVLLARALESRNQSAFGSALEALLARHQEQFAILVANARVSDETAATAPYFCAEGLALVRLAEQIGFALRDEYPLIPSLARADFSANFDAEGWRRVR